MSDQRIIRSNAPIGHDFWVRHEQQKERKRMYRELASTILFILMLLGTIILVGALL